MLKNLVRFLRFGYISNLVSNLNDIPNLISNIKNIKTEVIDIKYQLKTSEINNPNLITNKFVNNFGLTEKFDNSWTLYDLFNNYDNIDGISINQNADYLYIIDKEHKLEILKENVHYVKIIPSLIEKIIDLCNKHHIVYDIL